MKKLMIAVAAVAMGVAAQAAQIAWSVGAVDGDGFAALDYAGCTVYICSLGSGFGSVDDVKAAAMGPLVEGGAQGVLADTGFGDEIGAFGGIQNASWSEGDTVPLWAVIVNSNETGYWSVSGSAEAFETSPTHADFSLDAASLLASPATDFQTVPEPTSGLLLLLGVAGLALKRRRA